MVVPAATTLALLGPSGCGKTTLLRAIAGLEPLLGGSVVLDDRLVAGPGAFVAPEQRRIGMVFQDAALFPHLSVADNVGFGLRALTRHDRRDRVDEMLDLVGVASLADRKPGTLSGGQRQRVALARSLAPAPAVLLLDEPFSALDASLRARLRHEVVSIIRSVGVTAVFVTHDQEEAFVIGDQVAVMRHGSICQIGTPEELYAAPADEWVADFVGDANMVDGVASGRTAETVVGTVPLEVEHRGAVRVLVRPEALHVVAGDDAEVVDVEFYGHDMLVRLIIRSGEHLAVRCRPAMGPAIGSNVGIRYAGPPAVAFGS
jgi:iron(III) transport system ATP-binding protein